MPVFIPARAARAALACAALVATCSNAADTDLDAGMARAYEHAAVALAPAAAAELRGAQAQWRDYMEHLCPAAKDDRPGDVWTHAACIADAQQRRIAQLNEAGLRVGGGLVLTRIDHYSYEPPRTIPLPVPDPNPLEVHVAYPQIDRPASPAQLEWNRALAKPLPPRPLASESGSDWDVDYEIGCANDRLLSLRFTSYEFPHGAAHGMTTLHAENFVLAPTLRAMTPEDLFAPDSNWREKLPDLLWQAYLDDGGKFASDATFEANMRAAAVKPDHWLLTPQGLEFDFSAYEIGCYACGPGPLTIPWARLAPLLASQPAPACEAASRDPD